MDADDLRAVLTLGEYRHFGRAADALGVSQPALTKRISRLETRLGGALFSRHPRGAEATAAGRILIDRAARLLDDAAQAEQMTRSAIAGSTGFLRIGVGLPALLLGLPAMLASYRKRYPAVQLTVRDMSTSGQIEALRRGDLDIGFLRAGSDCEGLRVEPVLRDELQIACPAAIAPRMVRGGRASIFRHPLVTVPRSASPTFHDHVTAVCIAIGYNPPSVQEANQLLTVLALVQAGMGISLVPSSMRALRIPGIRYLATGSAAASSWTIALAWNPSNLRNPAAAAAIRMFRRRAETF